MRPEKQPSGSLSWCNTEPSEAPAIYPSRGEVAHLDDHLEESMPLLPGVLNMDEILADFSDPRLIWMIRHRLWMLSQVPTPSLQSQIVGHHFC